MKTKNLLIATGFVACLMGVSTASAGPIVFDNGPPDGDTLVFSDPNCGACGSGYQQLADDFIFVDDTVVADISFWGGYFPNNVAGDVSASIIFYGDAAGMPGTEIISFGFGDLAGRTDIGEVAGVDLFEYTLDFAPTLFSAGTAYWVSVLIEAADAGADWGWADTFSGGNGAYPGIAFRTDGAGGWTPFEGFDMAFNLSAGEIVDTPEPGTLALLGLGLAGLGFSRRRKLA